MLNPSFVANKTLEADSYTERAKDAPVIRQLFSSSPRDPRYHMLQYISAKFSQKLSPQPHEPRAALFLNRFSRTLTIMYATNGLADLLGISNDHLTGKSFYYCIQENCLREAVKCLESAKANDSIAYLRFWFRDPRLDDRPIDRDERMSDGHSSGDDDDGGVNLAELMDHDGSEHAVTTGSSSSMRSSVERDAHSCHAKDSNLRSLSENSTDNDGNANDTIFDPPEGVQQSRTSSISTPDEPRGSREPWPFGTAPVELEAVVSCTSDGLVVVLRRARPFLPQITAPTAETPKNPYVNGFFASPWANEPILPDIHRRSDPQPNEVQPMQFPVNPTAEQANTAATLGPASEDFMNSIREVAVFAWSLTGINGSLAQYGRGTPSGESQPDRLQVWQPNSTAGPESDRHMDYTTLSQSNTQYNTSQYAHQPRSYSARTDHRQTYSYLSGLPNNGVYDSWQPDTQGTNGYGYGGAGDVPMQISGQDNGFNASPQNGNFSSAHKSADNGDGLHHGSAMDWNGSAGVQGSSPSRNQEPAYDVCRVQDQSQRLWRSG